MTTEKNVSAEQVQALSMERVFELFLRREARDLAKEQQDLDRKAAQQAQLEKNAKEDNIKFLYKQTTCNHLKGASSKGSAKHLRQTIDPNVYRHTFIDGSTYIKCMNCRAKWIPEDTMQYLFRGGKHISNHTKIGWAEALQLTSISSNQQSSSEIPGQVIATSMAEKLRNATPSGGSLNLLPRDKEGNEVANVQY